VNSLPKTVTRQRCGSDLNPSPTEPDPSTITTRLPRQFTLGNPKIIKNRLIFDSYSEKNEKVDAFWNTVYRRYAYIMPFWRSGVT